jgi:hypothetical protein
MRRIITIIVLVVYFGVTIFAQNEILTNKDVIQMTQTGLSSDLIVLKIRQTKGKYDTTTQDLIDLKKAGVTDEVIKIMLEKPQENPTIEKPFIKNPGDVQKTHVVLEPKEALNEARTVAIKKDSLNPSPQALEKELLKRKDWKSLNLNIVRYTEDADLLIEISFVPFSIITHRYTFRVYDNKSGTVIAAGETTSWGSLAENLAREISKKMVQK